MEEIDKIKVEMDRLGVTQAHVVAASSYTGLGTKLNSGPLSIMLNSEHWGHLLETLKMLDRAKSENANFKPGYARITDVDHECFDERVFVTHPVTEVDFSCKVRKANGKRLLPVIFNKNQLRFD